MAFSFFRRKGKADTPRDEHSASDRVSAQPGAAEESDTLAARRRAARLTEEKIDQIESRMIADAQRSASSPPEGQAPPTAPGRWATVVAQATLPLTDWFEGTSNVLPGGRPSAMAIDINASALPGVLEQAAIQFSSGKVAAAGETLRQALADADLGAFRQLGWLMLLDLHQFTNAKAAFESLALDYAARFESSPPNWSDAPGLAADVEPATANSIVALPARIGDSVGSRIDLIERGMARRRETIIDFGPVQSIDAAGAARLLALLRRFENAPSRFSLIVREPRRLFEAARAAVEPGRRDESDACWMVALFALRLLDEAQRFEDLGIEYCVTYEVSPPSWEARPRSIRLADDAVGASDEQPAAATLIFPPAEPNAFVLAGEIVGRMQDDIKGLRAFSAGRPDVVIDCRALRRIEFAAVGELLNEIVTLRTAGKQVLIVEPNRLVYALMLVMGIQELAEIRERRI